MDKKAARLRRATRARKQIKELGANRLLYTVRQDIFMHS